MDRLRKEDAVMKRNERKGILRDVKDTERGILFILGEEQFCHYQETYKNCL
jgi:hypothetical protein